MPYLTARDNTKLYVKDWGEGRPVILLHGWPLSADSWDDQAMAIAQSGFRVIAYDRRGFGRSDQPWEGYNYDNLADDLADVIKETGATDATIVGFSMGGGEVARYMSRHNGQNVVQAGLISSVVPYMLKTDDNPQGTPQDVFDQMVKGLKGDRAHFFATFFKAFYGVDTVLNPPSAELLEWSRAVAMQSSLKADIACAKAFATTDFRPDLASFSVPTLIIHGTNDQTVPIDPAGRAAAKSIPQSQLIEYENAPHGLFVTHKEQFTQDLMSFLSS
jgi:non-heme chloroperoxidase